MEKIGGTKGWVVLTTVATLMALAVIPAFAGSASASPAPISAANAPADQWAYGGTGYSNNSLTIGNQTLTWNATFGWTVVFTATATAPNTVQIEEQRTVGIDLTAKYSSPTEKATYSYVAHEQDLVFANLTNASTVYVGGVPMPALGLDNDTTQVAGSISEAISVTAHGFTKSASLDVTGAAHTSAQFWPSLGLVPLNLSGVTTWNSTSTIHPDASWNITFAWANNGFNGENGSGSKTANGTMSASGPVNLTGFVLTTFHATPNFPDHLPRHAIVLIVQGPLGNYDEFVLVPHDFDFFGAGAHAWDSESDGSAAISAETLYFSPGSSGPQVTAAATTFGTSTGGISGVGQASTGVSPAVSASPGATVVGSPMSVSQAQAEAKCLTGGCSASPVAAAGGFAGALVVAALVIVAVVGTIVVVEWRSYARRRPPSGLVGGYSETWPNGVPPAAAGVAPQTPPAPASSGSTAPEAPARRL